MAENGNGNGNMNGKSADRESNGGAIRDFMKDLRIAQDAVAKEQEENRRLGIPNWYQINGEIVSDIELANRKGVKK